MLIELFTVVNNDLETEGSFLCEKEANKVAQKKGGLLVIASHIDLYYDYRMPNRTLLQSNEFNLLSEDHIRICTGDDDRRSSFIDFYDLGYRHALEANNLIKKKRKWKIIEDEEDDC